MPGGTVDFMTSTASVVPAGIAPMTASTRLRSASPDALGGVSTHTKAIEARSNSSVADDVNVSRSRPSASTRSRPGSWNGASPARRRSSFASSMSRQTTIMPGLREARRRDQSDVADADDAEPLCSHSPALREAQAGARRAGTRLFAIEIIVSGDSLSSSELSIQTTTPPAALQGLPP